jgi:hypothetical protein
MTEGTMTNRVCFLGRLFIIRALAAVALTIGLAGRGGVPAALAAPAPLQQSFASANAAIEALVGALRSQDVKELRAILGQGSEKLLVSGDAVADAAGRAKFLEAYDESHKLVPQTADRMDLVIGQDGWPFPIPVVQVDQRWRFDAKAGAQEIINRRIGRNELMTIRTLLAVVKAEEDYFDRVKRGTGAGFYARKFVSSHGLRDGLYWDAQSGQPASPLAPLLAQAENEGYPDVTTPSSKPRPYQGYLYRILTSQGPNAQGGRLDYLKNGLMTEGFAIVAWPAEHGASGIMTFLVDRDGVLFQKDLGPATAKIAGAMAQFDPDLTWARVDLKD